MSPNRWVDRTAHLTAAARAVAALGKSARSPGAPGAPAVAGIRAAVAAHVEHELAATRLAAVCRAELLDWALAEVARRAEVFAEARGQAGGAPFPADAVIAAYGSVTRDLAHGAV